MGGGRRLLVSKSFLEESPPWASVDYICLQSVLSSVDVRGFSHPQQNQDAPEVSPAPAEGLIGVGEGVMNHLKTLMISASLLRVEARLQNDNEAAAGCRLR